MTAFELITVIVVSFLAYKFWKRSKKLETENNDLKHKLENHKDQG